MTGQHQIGPRPGRATVLLVLLAGLAVAACTGPETTAPTAELRQPATPPQTVVEAAPPALSAPRHNERLQPQVARRPPTAAPLPPADPAQIMGLEAPALVNLLGNPWLRRDESQAQVWLYAEGLCVFHVFLYADRPDGPYAVRYFDAVPRVGIPIDSRDCFTRLLRRAESRRNIGA